MEATYNDPVFGTMTYKHRWYKQQKISLFGKVWEVVVAAKAYSGKPITEEQQNSYRRFFDNAKEMADKIADNLKGYVNTNLQEFAIYWKGARTVNSTSDLAQMVTPKTLLFQQDGTTILLLDCVWDPEHGVAVRTYPQIAVGSQDLFL